MDKTIPLHILLVIMKTLSLCMAVLVISTSLFADTLVLKNGKKIEGTVVEEDAEGYRIRDSQGIVIFVKKSQLDANASQITKEPEPDTSKAKNEQPEITSKNPSSVAEVARESRDNKKGNVRVLRKEDLDKMPEVSIIGTETAVEEEGEEGSDPAEERTTEDRTSVRSEEYWKEETRRFAISIRDAQRDAEELDQECEDLGKQAAYAVTDPTQYVEINGVLIPIAGSGYDASTIQAAQEVCRDAEKAKKELSRLQQDLEEFQDYARRQGALPGWVDPDRL